MEDHAGSQEEQQAHENHDHRTGLLKIRLGEITQHEEKMGQAKGNTSGRKPPYAFDHQQQVADPGKHECQQDGWTDLIHAETVKSDQTWYDKRLGNVPQSAVAF